MGASDRRQPECRIGTSGYQYDHWRGLLYPDDLPKKDWFDRYAQTFDTVEINNTFYRLPGPETFEAWRDAAPPGFRYALKFSRFATHMKKLKDPAEPVARFLDRADRLKAYLGPILVQLPPRWKVNRDRLATFLDALPRRHRWAVEFREPTWLSEPVYDLLREHDAALCIHDMLPDHPRVLTADWVYLRFHGGDAGGGNYSEAALADAARRVRGHLDAGRDVYAYYNNDVHGHAVRNALNLRHRVTGA